MNNKKILILSTAYYPLIGGAEVAIKEITDRIEDIEFDLLTARMDKNLPKNEKIGNVNVFRFGFGYAFIDKILLAFLGHRKAQKLHKQNNYNTVWAMMASHGGLAASKFKAKNPNIKFLLTLQEGDSLEYIYKKTRFIKRQFKNIFIKADRIQCISKYLADWAKDMGAKSPIEIIPNGVDVDVFSQKYSEDELNKLKLEMDKKDGDKFIITTSRLSYKNAIDDLIKSIIYLPNNFKLLILGEGEDKVKLEIIVKENNLGNRVRFLGFVDYKELPKYLRISDVFVRASLSEGFGNSFVEAMVTKIPVIATPVGGIVDFLEDEKTGLFCKVKDPESIAEKIKKIIDDDELRSRIIENAHQMVIDRYDWNLIALDMKKVFDSLILGK